MKKCVLVTGACINTGVDIVNKFAENGVNVVFTGRSKDKVEKALNDYKNSFKNIEIHGFVIDSLIDARTVDEKSVYNLFGYIKERRLFAETIVLNAADQGLNQKIFQSPLTDFSKVINTNVIWNYLIIETGAREMMTNGGGNVILVNSNTAYRAIPDRIAYETSKSAQLGMMRGLALDLGKYGIRVNAVLPGMIKTDRWEKNPDFYNNVPSRFTPIGDVATGKDIANAVYYFAAMASNTTGAELIVDGGNTIQMYPLIK